MRESDEQGAGKNCLLNTANTSISLCYRVVADISQRDRRLHYASCDISLYLIATGLQWLDKFLGISGLTALSSHALVIRALGSIRGIVSGLHSLVNLNVDIGSDVGLRQQSAPTSKNSQAAPSVIWNPP